MINKKTFTIQLVLLLTISALEAAAFIPCSHANGFILPPPPEELSTQKGYIRSNGDVDPPTLPIRQHDNMYWLTDDIRNFTLKIERSNIILDGKGFAFFLPAYGEIDQNGQRKSPQPLISISGGNCVTLQNFTFHCYSDAIYVLNSTRIRIFNNTMQNDNSGTAIYIANSSNIGVFQNVICKSTGVFMIRSFDCAFIANIIRNNQNIARGMLVQDCMNLTISYNIISNRNYAGIEFDDLTRNIFKSLQNSNITRNSFIGNQYAGLYFLGSPTNNRIFENNFIGNDIGLSFMHTSSVNNSFNNNYWEGNRIQINDYQTYRIDASPLSNRISTDVNQSLFIFPSNAEIISAAKSTTAAESEGMLLITVVVVFAIAAVLLIYFKRIRKSRLAQPDDRTKVY